MEEKKGSSGAAWTDRDKLAYIALLLSSSACSKIDWALAPIPAGRSQIACQRMVDKLRGQLKTEINSLMDGATVPEGSTTRSPVKTPRKRSTKATTGDDGPGDNEMDTKLKSNRKRKPKAEKDEESAGEPQSPTKKGKRATKTGETSLNDEEGESGYEKETNPDSEIFTSD